MGYMQANLHLDISLENIDLKLFLTPLFRAISVNLPRVC